jgi:hypothetical protein
MLLGLTNAPATFQALMNKVLSLFLRRFVLVFFDDILIYSESWSEHLRLVHPVLAKLREHNLFIMYMECAFGELSMVYLGHVIFEEGITMDKGKVQAALSDRHRARYGRWMLS